MKKNIWFINEYAGSPHHGMEFRHYYLAKELIKLGYDVTIISASYSHLFKKLPEIKSKFTFENIDGINYLWIRVNNYGASHNTKRVLKWLKFSFNLLRLPLKELSNPDSIILSSTQPFPILPLYLLNKKIKARLIVEIKDIWPLTLVSLGSFTQRHPLIKVMSILEKFALKKSDIIVSNLPNYGAHIKELGIKKEFVYIPNGIDIDELKEIEPLSDRVIKKIPDNKFIVGYTGTMGVANALEHILLAAEILKTYTNIFFVFVGDGQEKEKLKKQSAHLKNILFIETIPKKQIQSLLSFFDICYISSQKEDLYKYGIAANKLFDYMYSGKPVLQSIDTKKDVISMANCGLSVEAENPQAIADGILKLYKMPANVRKQLGENGREYVQNYHTYEGLAKKYSTII